MLQFIIGTSTVNHKYSFINRKSLSKIADIITKHKIFF
jgi:hypothetical protein